MCKYLNRLGFHAYVFGVNKTTGLVDVEAGDGSHTVVSGVTEEAANQIIAYLVGLEERVVEHMDLHYDIKL